MSENLTNKLTRINGPHELDQSLERVKEYLKANPYTTVFDIEEDNVQLKMAYFKIKYTDQASHEKEGICYLEVDSGFVDQIYGEKMQTYLSIKQ